MVLASGCAVFREDHYFAQRVQIAETGSDEPGLIEASDANYFRIRVEGSAKLSKARYVAGYYDPRALDLFFNEITTTDIAPIFEQDVTLPGTDERLVPLSTASQGDFTMIFSTSASAVANAIGNFAEANATADAITNLLNRDQVARNRASNANLQVERNRAASTVADINAILTRIQARQTDDEPVDDEMLRLLNSIGRALGASASFEDVAEAKAWFDVRRNQGLNP